MSRCTALWPATEGLDAGRCDDTSAPHSTNSLGIVVHHWRGMTTNEGTTYPDYRTWGDAGFAPRATDAEDVHA